MFTIDTTLVTQLASFALATLLLVLGNADWFLEAIIDHHKLERIAIIVTSTLHDLDPTYGQSQFFAAFVPC